MGVCSDGGLHKENLPSEPAHRGGLQSWWQHRLQIPGGEPRQSGACAVLR